MTITPEGYKFLVKYLGLGILSKKDRFATFEKPLLKKMEALPKGSPDRQILEGMLAEIRDNVDTQSYAPDSDMEKLARAVERAVKDHAEGKGSTDFVIELQSATMPEEIRNSLKDGEAMGLVKVAMVQCATAFTGPERAIALLKAKLKIENKGLEFDAPFRLSEKLETLRSQSGTTLFVEFRNSAQLHATLVRENSEQAAGLLKELSKGLTGHVKSVETKCKELVQDITLIMSDPGRLKTTIAEVENDNAAVERRKLWAAYRATADETIRQLEWWSDPNAPGLRKRHTDLAEPKGDKTGDEKAIAAAETLLNDAKKQVVTARGAFDKEKEKILGDLAKVEQRLKQVAIDFALGQTGIGGTDGSGDTKLNRELLDKCDGEVTAIRSILNDGANMGSLQAARDLLTSITTSLDQRRDAIKSGDIEMLTFLIDSCEGLLDDSEIKKFMPEGLAALRKTYDEVASKSVGMPPDKQIAEYQSVRDKLMKLLTDAQSRGTKLKTFENSKKSARQAMDKIAKDMKDEGPKDKPQSDDKDFYKKYHGPLATRWSVAVNLAQEESLAQVDKAVAEMKAVVEDCVKILKAMKTTKDKRTPEEKELVTKAIEGQIVGVSEKRQREADAATFKEAYKSFNMKVDAAALRAEGKPEIVNEIRGYGTMGKNAKDLFDSQHNLEKAMSILDKAKKSIEVALNKLKVRPSDLAKLATDWQKACGSLKTELEKLAEAAVAAAKDLPDDSDLKEAAGGVKEQLLAAAGAFQPAPGFDKAQLIYAKNGATSSELKVAREAVLQQVRLFMERLSNDPVIRAAQANPFGQRDAVSPLYARLRSIELKALVTA